MTPRVDDAKPPVCVDLDGTLIFSDLLLESFMLLIKRNPLYAFACVWWLVRGKAHLKANIASRVQLNGSALPYNHGLIAWLQERKQAGQALWLCTASDQRLAHIVAAHVGIFDGVLSSDGKANPVSSSLTIAATLLPTCRSGRWHARRSWSMHPVQWRQPLGLDPTFALSLRAPSGASRWSPKHCGFISGPRTP